MRIRYPRCLKMLVGRWVLATGRHISRSRRTTSTYFENGSRTHTQKLTANYHLPRNVCIRLTWASALAAQCTLACSTHYTHVCTAGAIWRQSGAAERARQINQNLGFRSSATLPRGMICPTFFANVPRPYIPLPHLWGIATPMHYLGYDFLFL